MKFKITLFLILFSIFFCRSQDWKTYPHTPTGSLISFSIDEGRHPAEETEWWYTVGHVTGSTTGNKYSYMLTYFYNPALGYDGFRIFNLTNDDTGENLFDTQPIKYDILSQISLDIKVSNHPLKKPESWKNKLDTDNKAIPFEYTLYASSDNTEINLEYITVKRPLILGDDGKFDLGSSSYTYYYSQTKNLVIGTITFKDITEDVTGISWIDHQYGSYNGKDDEKYEWFSVQLSNGMDLNLWNLFTDDNTIPDIHNYKILSAYVDENTQYTTKDFNLERLEFKFTSDNEKCYSQKWRLTSNTNNIDLIISVLHGDSEVQLPFRFYEGATSITGSVNGIAVTGKGFAELLHSYEIPKLNITHPNNGTFYSSENITWDVSNSDDGNPLLYDVFYSVDNKQTFKNITEGHGETSFYWENPDIQSGEEIWFKITAYSKDKTLTNEVISANSSSFVLPVEEFNSNNIILYPNPSENSLKINFDNYIPLLVYKIYDINGKILLEKEIRNKKILQIDIKKLKKGIYFLNINHSNKSMYTKFIVE